MLIDADPRLPQHDVVVLYRGKKNVPAHEGVIHENMARRLARLLDLPFDGTYDRERHAGMHCYFLPDTTLVGPDLKSQLRINDENDLFGGCVDHAFSCTKAITHPLPDTRSSHPTGWSDAFAKQVRAATLPGYTAFSIEDVRMAARQLFSQGWSVRLKPVLATAGRGQRVVTHEAALETALAHFDLATLSRSGLVLEGHLEDVITYSVGQVRLPGGLMASYVGTQGLTRDNAGEWVYGGSRLCVVRGHFNELDTLPLDEDCRHAISLARCYDAAADAHQPGFIASRRNYDVVAGKDAQGRHYMGVLEQSWRVGGASRAEIAALETFAADPDCHAIVAETIELFGESAMAPPDAVETFRGVDPDIGLIHKYIRVDRHGHHKPQHRN